MEQPSNDTPIRNLDFTGQGRIEEQAKIVVPGVGAMTIEDAEKFISPGKIPGSHIEFNEGYTFASVELLRDEMVKHQGLFSPEDRKTYAGFIQEIEKRLLVLKALEEHNNKVETVH